MKTVTRSIRAERREQAEARQAEFNKQYPSLWHKMQREGLGAKEKAKLDAVFAKHAETMFQPPDHLVALDAKIDAVEEKFKVTHLPKPEQPKKRGYGNPRGFTLMEVLYCVFAVGCFGAGVTVLVLVIQALLKYIN